MPHPIRSCAAAVADAVKDVADLDPVFMSPADKAAALHELAAVAARLAELRLRVLASAEDLAVDTGAQDAGAWLAATAPVDAPAARADLRLGEALTRWQRLRTGLAEGVVSVDQARVIVQVLADLPDDLEVTVRAEAEAELVRLAADYSPGQLRKLGLHLLTVLAPEVADELEARRLDAAERRAAAGTSLTLRPTGDGLTRLTGRLPDAVAERLRTVLESFAQPRRAALDADGRAHPRHHLLGEALGQLLETLDPKRLPLHGGDATTIIVTIPLDQLQTQLGSGLIEGTGLTAGQIRRLACTAKILPAVLGTKSEVLDLGRSARLFTPAQRKALRLRDQHCRAEGCTVPARWCDAHHLDPWAHGGRTDLDRGLLLCGHHHRRAHDTAYDTRRMPNGDFRFTRRT